MQDIRIDSNGDLRCWNCGNRHFLGKRTGRAHMAGYATCWSRSPRHQEEVEVLVTMKAAMASDNSSPRSSARIEQWPY